jgi:Putative DNA-binding domain
MRPISEWEETDLDEIVREGLKESSTLEYKDSRALGKRDGQWTEMCKDVSAFANSDGGILVYGIQERDHKPVAVDEGVDPAALTKEWIENILHVHIQPRIDHLVIKPIELKSKGAGTVAYAIEIGQATSRAPHQGPQKLYYKRFNFKAEALGDSEVRDLMRRGIAHGRKYAAAWDLSIEVRRLAAAANEREKISGDAWLLRTQLIIGVSHDLRASGDKVIHLERSIRSSIADLANEVDIYNSIIEVVDPGQREQARVSNDLKRKLFEIRKRCDDIDNALQRILTTEP